MMMATTDFNIDQTLCQTKNSDGSETAVCIFETLSTGEDATLSQDKIRNTTYELVCGCLLFTGDEADETETEDA